MKKNINKNKKPIVKNFVFIFNSKYIYIIYFDSKKEKEKL